jgi:hypothetical protein
VNVLVLQHIACEPPGVFEDVLLERGAQIIRVELDEAEPPPSSLQRFDAGIAMGGPMSATVAQAFVAAGIAVVPMHGLILATLPFGATARPLVERQAGSRTIEGLAPAAARTPAVDDLLDHLADAARGYASRR